MQLYRWNAAFLIGVAVAMAGCLSAPPPTTESRSQEVKNGPDDPPDPDPDPVCTATPSCTFTFIGGYQSTLQQQLGCSQSYRYMNGFPAGFMGGIGFFCPNTSTVRNLFHSYAAFAPGYCDDCVTVPASKIFVFWTEFVGPGCPSGCSPGPYPSPL
jgi:hypothetical protein